MAAQTISVPAKNIPVYKEVDVLVVGGGPAGFSSAVSAARAGAKTLLVERYGVLGGMWTAALVNPFFESQDKGGLCEELMMRLKKRNAWGGLWNIAYDPPSMVLELDAMIREAGVDLLLYALGTTPIMDGDTVTGAVVETKSGPLAIKAKQVIDCTGDADLAARAGVPFKTGRPADGLMQPMTMMFRIGGLSPDYPQHKTNLWHEALKKIHGEDEVLKQVPFGHPAFISLPRKGEAMVQWTHMRNFDATDAGALTQATLEGRQQVERAMALIRTLPESFGAPYLLDLPVSIGIRETRRIEGQYEVTLADLQAGRRFDDGICLVRFPIDIHEPGDGAQAVIYNDPYHVPYRSLVPVKVKNLLVAGRPISGSYEAHASYRVTGCCVSMGEAAGLAAARCAAGGKSPAEIDGAAIADSLRKQGVNLDNGDERPEDPEKFGAGLI